MKTHKKKTYDRGMNAERFAALWLQIKGYKVLARRYKTPVGEIDLIVQKGNAIAFVEVKARVTKAQALESLTTKMQKRIERAASYYISHHDVLDYDMRFDLAVVTGGLFGTFLIHHLDNAWQQSA